MPTKKYLRNKTNKLCLMGKIVITQRTRSVSSGSTNTCYSLNDKSGPSNKIILNLLSLPRELSFA